MSLRPNDKFIVLDALTYAGSLEHLPISTQKGEDERLQFWYGDVTNPELVKTLVSQSNIVIHFAAETHVTRSIFDNNVFFHTDVIGTQTIANAIVQSRDNIERFIHISTSEVYGTALDEKIDEDHTLMPFSPYAAAKCGADRLVYSYWKTYDLPATIIRPFNCFGPRQHLEKVIPRFITSVILDEPVTIHGDGSAARDFIFVEDLCDAIQKVVEAPLVSVAGEVFNVATGQHRDIKSIAHDIITLMDGNKDRIKFLGDRPGQVVRHTGDASKISRLLGWSNQSSWISGLQKTIDWYSENSEIWKHQIWLRYVPITLPNGRTELH